MVFKHQPFTVQSNFLMSLLLMENHFNSPKTIFQGFSLCAVSTQRVGVWLAFLIPLLHHRPLPLTHPRAGIEPKACHVGIRRLLDPISANSYLCSPCPTLIKNEETEVWWGPGVLTKQVVAKSSSVTWTSESQKTEFGLPEVAHKSRYK